LDTARDAAVTRPQTQVPASDSGLDDSDKL
jgi:hypothetical protein